jgi:hypothetical protein
MPALLKSSRVRITIIAMIVWGAARAGLELDAAAVDKILDMAMVLVASFGATGWGKERVAEAAKTGGSITTVEITTTIPPQTAGAPTSDAVENVLGRERGRPLSEAGKVREEARRPTPEPGTPPLPGASRPPGRSG